MAYSAWSVVFGEVPTDSKWNILGTNDDSFNDGTGIADDAIVKRHFDDDQIDTAQLTSAMIDYKELGRAELSATGTVLDINPIPAVKYLKIICGLVASATGVNMNFKFNGDTGNNYAQQYSANHATPGTSDPSIGGIAGEVGNFVADGCSFVIFDIYNPSGADKIGQLGTVHQTALTSATIPAWSDLQALWNSGNQITRITATAVSGSLKAGSKLIVLGHD